MPSTIEQTKEAILKYGGKASKHQITRELKISLDYLGLILGELKRKGEVIFSDGFYSLTQKKPARRSEKSKGTKKAKKSKIHKNSTRSLTSILGVNASLVQTLRKAGYATVESLAEVPISRLMETVKLELHTAAQLINRARKIARKIK